MGHSMGAHIEVMDLVAQMKSTEQPFVLATVVRTVLAIKAEYHAFVGSRRKMAALREKLVAGGSEAAAIDRVKAPAGLDLGAITPEEIAMSILAEITVER